MKSSGEEGTAVSVHVPTHSVSYMYYLHHYMYCWPGGFVCFFLEQK